MCFVRNCNCISSNTSIEYSRSNPPNNIRSHNPIRQAPTRFPRLNILQQSRRNRISRKTIRNSRILGTDEKSRTVFEFRDISCRSNRIGDVIMWARDSEKLDGSLWWGEWCASVKLSDVKEFGFCGTAREVSSRRGITCVILSAWWLAFRKRSGCSTIALIDELEGSFSGRSNGSRKIE